MSLTFHPARLFRLSCGCLRAYTMMSATVKHTVLCPSCRKAAVTVVVYPEQRCAVTGWAVVDGRELRVSCTRERGACAADHADEFAGAVFTVAVTRITPSSEGKTGKA